MPLHLLGKKSWNVYNAANIARVKADEEAAAARETAEDQRMQALDAERRAAILRGQTPPPLPEPTEHGDSEQTRRSNQRGPGEKRRRRVGESETDMEIRLAASATKPSSRSGSADNMQYWMGISEAEHKARDLRVAEIEEEQRLLSEKNAARRQREQARLASADPLLTMKQATTQLDKQKAARKELNSERSRELLDLKVEQAEQERTQKRRARHERHERKRHERKRHERERDHERSLSRADRTRHRRTRSTYILPEDHPDRDVRYECRHERARDHSFDRKHGHDFLTLHRAEYSADTRADDGDSASSRPTLHRRRSEPDHGRDRSRSPKRRRKH